MALASVDAQGRPDVRMVLLKNADARGFVFYTNLESAKGTELQGRPDAALCFHWKSLRRAVRISAGACPSTLRSAISCEMRASARLMSSSRRTVFSSSCTFFLPGLSGPS